MREAERKKRETIARRATMTPEEVAEDKRRLERERKRRHSYDKDLKHASFEATGGFIILEESDPEKILEESIESNKRLSETLLVKKKYREFLNQAWEIYIRKTIMRYLRILKKDDFEESLEKDKEYLELTAKLKELGKKRTEIRSKLKTAGTDVSDYQKLSRQLDAFDRKLEKAYEKYAALRDQRAAFVKEINTTKKKVYNDAREDIQYFSNKFKKIDKEIQQIEKAIQNFKALKYRELSEQRIKTKAREDNISS